MGIVLLGYVSYAEVFLWVALAAVCVALLCVAVGTAIRDGQRKAVREKSARYRALVRLNERYEGRFHRFGLHVSEPVRCSTRQEFDRFDRVAAWDHVIGRLADQNDEVRQLLVKVAWNRSQGAEYESQLGMLPASTFDGALGKVENEMCSALRLCLPVGEVRLRLDVTYTSPAGRSRRYKEFEYGEQQLREAVRQAEKRPLEEERRRREREAERERQKRERNKVTLKLRQKVLVRDGFRCVRCGASPQDGPEVRLEVDHIVPISRGGKTEMSNLQTLCQRCNRGKGASMP